MKSNIYYFPSTTIALNKNLNQHAFYWTLFLSLLLLGPGFGFSIGQDVDSRFDLQASHRRAVAAQEKEKKISLVKIGDLEERNFRIPRKKIKKVLGWLTFISTINNAERIESQYRIQVFASCFTAKEKPISNNDIYYDYYDIKLVINFLHNADLPKEAYILPEGYKIEAYPVSILDYRPEWKPVHSNKCQVSPMSWNPQCIASGTMHTTTNQFTFNGDVGFPSGGTLGATYSYSSALSRELKDVELFPKHQDNKIKWKIKYNHLHLRGGCNGFRPAHSLQQELRWLWRVRRDSASQNLYAYPLNPRGHYAAKPYFNFAIKMSGSFQGVGYLRNRIVRDVPIIDGPQIVSLAIPELPQEDDEPLRLGQAHALLQIAELRWVDYSFD